MTRSPRVEDLPAVRGLVPRRLLFDRLSALGPGEVGLLCAPAGSGKTALVRSWAASEELADRVAWVSVERAEVPDRVQPAGPVHGGVRSG